MGKIKVGTLIEKDIWKAAKVEAVKQERSINDLLNEALENYLKKDINMEKREKAFRLFCNHPILSKKKHG